MEEAAVASVRSKKGPFPEIAKTTTRVVGKTAQVTDGGQLERRGCGWKMTQKPDRTVSDPGTVSSVVSQDNIRQVQKAARAAVKEKAIIDSDDAFHRVVKWKVFFGVRNRLSLLCAPKVSLNQIRRKKSLTAEVIYFASPGDRYFALRASFLLR